MDNGMERQADGTYINRVGQVISNRGTTAPGSGEHVQVIQPNGKREDAIMVGGVAEVIKKH